MKKLILFCLLSCFLSTAVFAQQADSVMVERLLQTAPVAVNPIIHYARQLKGRPYVPKTLEINKEERLVVNLRQLDCTTFVESVMALVIARQSDSADFSTYCRALKSLRYRDGKVDYCSRSHYFSWWIDEQIRQGRAFEVAIPPTFSPRSQNLQLDFMSTHSELYPMLIAHPEWISRIDEQERATSGKRVVYLPKTSLNDNKALRNLIHDGDIIAITTNKSGLDISHVGFAIWLNDGLHLFHASSIHKRVLVEPRPLFQYMASKTTQTGIRIIRFNL